jgi:hypothetical protein
MVKMKGATAAASTSTSATGPNAAAATPKKVVPAAAAIVRDALGDWTASTMMKRDKKKARSLGLTSYNEGDIISRFRFSSQSSCRIYYHVSHVFVSWVIPTGA